MFQGLRSLLGIHPQRSEVDEKLDEALANATALDHYFFFSDKADASHAAGRLQQRGWTIVSMGLHPSQQKWLLQARQNEPADDLPELQSELDLLADDHHGEYDGWQVPGVTEDL